MISHQDLKEIPSKEIASESRNSESVHYDTQSPTKEELCQCHNFHWEINSKSGSRLLRLGNHLGLGGVGPESLLRLE